MERETNAEIIQQLAEMMRSERWYWIVGEIEVQEPDHECTADCEHWKEENK